MPTLESSSIKGAREYDVVIVGGGLVGASLAVALEPAGLSLAVVEPVAARDACRQDGATANASMPHDADDDANQQPSFDQRTVALTYNARQIYSGMGVWPQIAEHAQPIREIHLSDRGHFGMTHLSHADVGVEALGYVAPSAAIGQILHQRMRQSAAVSVFCPATATRIRPQADCNLVALSEDGQADPHAQSNLTLSARLVVLADGGRSGLAAQIGLESSKTDYRQSAIISSVATDREHHGRAFERFTREGPLALLPQSAQRYAVAWTTLDARPANAADKAAANAELPARMRLSDAAFVAELQTVFGDRAGNFSQPTRRLRYPLRRGRARRPVGARAVLIGDAAHTMHPVAGQGFNLGLRDVAALAEAIHGAARRQADIGSARLLEQYAAARRRETWMVATFTDGLIKLFGSQFAPLGLARNLALAGMEWLPPAKRLLLRRTMGMAGRRSRLSLGLPLA